MKRTANEEIALEMLKKLPEKKRATLVKAMERNFILTSEYYLSCGHMTVYKEGFYLELEGCRCKFAVYAKDNDGELEIMERKPNESKLNKIWKDMYFLHSGYIFEAAGF